MDWGLIINECECFYLGIQPNFKDVHNKYLALFFFNFFFVERVEALNYLFREGCQLFYV